MGMKGIVTSTAGPRDPAQRGDRGHDPRLADARSPAPAASSRWRSPSRCSSRWACARSCPRSRPAPAAAARRRRSSRRWPARSPSTSRTGCPSGSETHPGVEEMKVAVMGCVVNGPGESKHADIGISLPGTFEAPVAPGVRRREARPDAPRRPDRRRVHRAPRGLRGPPVRRAVAAATPGARLSRRSARSAPGVRRPDDRGRRAAQAPSASRLGSGSTRRCTTSTSRGSTAGSGGWSRSRSRSVVAVVAASLGASAALAAGDPDRASGSPSPWWCFERDRWRAQDVLHWYQADRCTAWRAATGSAGPSSGDPAEAEVWLGAHQPRLRAPGLPRDRRRPVPRTRSSSSARSPRCPTRRRTTGPGACG